MHTTAAFLFCVTAAGCSRDVRPGTVPTEPTAVTDSENPMATARPDRDDGRNAGNVLLDPGAAEPKPIEDAIAILHPLGEHTAHGVVRFHVVEGELHVSATVDGLPAGAHAYHVHVFGDCSSPDGKSAGDHFHFSGSSFDKSVGMITGNLGEIRAGGSTTATYQQRVPGASLHGPFSIMGRSVVVHAQGNNPAVTPDGGAGARIACGVIGVANPGSQQTTRR
jgi:superoxide dismutase, Cu-Zn family